jgi:hypothetical protein
LGSLRRGFYAVDGGVHPGADPRGDAHIAKECGFKLIIADSEEQVRDDSLCLYEKVSGQLAGLVSKQPR